MSAVTLLSGIVGAPATPAAAATFNILVFSKTAGFRHSSAIINGIAMIQQLGAQNGFTVTATEDATKFTLANLSQYKAVVWLHTTGDVLDNIQQAEFEKYIAAGGGYVGIHAASDGDSGWPYYAQLVGAVFRAHPHTNQFQQATVKVADRVHPSTKGLPRRWVRTDEWYSFQSNPRGKVHVLATLDETTYNPEDTAMGFDHPIAWCQNFSGGRSWYTGMGHTDATYSEPLYQQHVLGGIMSAAGAVDSDCGATVDARFQQVTLAKGSLELGEPMSLAVLPDRSVLHTSRDGVLYRTAPTGDTFVAARLPVYYPHDEEGLQGVAIDPAFSTNRWVYLYYSPPLNTPSGDAPYTGTSTDWTKWRGYMQLSRFVLRTDGTLDMASEQKILQVGTDRGICCHFGGDIDFDAAGNLYLTTGDDTNAFQSDGYTPIDERSDRNPAFDAQRSSGNTNDLRGKLLRIHVNSDGRYSIPAGNLFAAGTAGTRPEIYAMGLRNPFRMRVDRATGWVYLGEYGPDAAAASATRGPGGMVEFNQIRAAGNYGWPYCVGPNTAYVDYNFATGVSGSKFNCAGPTNDSPRNTGLRTLPAAKSAWLTYDEGSVPEFGTGSESPMGGPVYRYDPANPSETKFPEYYNGTYFAMEFGRQWIRNIVLDDAGAPLKINPFPWSGEQIMDSEFGPDGALYVLDYGTGWHSTTADSGLYRIDYVAAGKRSPTAVASGTPTSGQAPLTVNFTSAGSSDPDGDALSYAWDFDGNGTTDSTAPNPSFTYPTNGQFTAKLTVVDATGRSGTARVVVTVGNTAPTVIIIAPADGSVLSFGDAFPFEVSVTDPEDGAVDCARVRVDYLLGHDNHAHLATSKNGCTGTIQTSSDGDHAGGENVFGVVAATYTDNGSATAPALTTTTQAILQPKSKQAEYFSATQGVSVVAANSAHAGSLIGFIGNGDWVSYQPYNLSGVTRMDFRVASATSGGTIEVRKNSPTGPLQGSVAVPGTGGWETWTTVSANVVDAGGSGPLYLVFKGSGSALMNVDDFTMTLAPDRTHNLALSRPVSASSVYSAGLEGAKAVDGNLATRWSSAFSDPQWISVDLGAARSVSRVRLFWEAAYAKSYKIQLSVDGLVWTDVYSTTAGNGGVDDIGFSGQYARYVRMYGTVRGTTAGYSLWEMEAYDAPAPTWSLRDTNGPGVSDHLIRYGATTCRPVTGDWAGAAGTPVTGIGVTCPVGMEWQWALRASVSEGDPTVPVFRYGNNQCVAVTGDWDGNGTTTIGVACPNGTEWQWNLRNANAGGSPDGGSFGYGNSACTPVTGDWDGNGTTTIGIVCKNGMEWQWNLRNANSGGTPDAGSFGYGNNANTPVTGDWNGDGRTTVGTVG